jgi:hypothetical protein
MLIQQEYSIGRKGLSTHEIAQGGRHERRPAPQGAGYRSEARLRGLSRIEVRPHQRPWLGVARRLSRQAGQV